jgi:hypothetical protein
MQRYSINLYISCLYPAISYYEIQILKKHITIHNHKYRLSEYTRCVCVWGGGGRMLATSDTTSRQTLQNVNSKRRLQRIQYVLYRKGKGIKFLILQICVITNLLVPSCFCLWSYGIFKLLRNPGIDYKESIPPAYVDWRAGTTTLFLLGS